MIRCIRLQTFDEAFKPPRRAHRRMCAEISEAARSRAGLIAPEPAKRNDARPNSCKPKPEWRVRQMNARTTQAAEAVKADLICD